MTSAEEDRLVRRHLPLVRAVVRNLAKRLPPNVGIDDLLAAGAFGLLTAIRQNGGDGGPTWKHYVCIRVRGAVFDELRRQDFVGRHERRRSAPTHVELSDHLVDPADVFETVADRFDDARLGRAMRDLDKRQAAVVRAYTVEGLKFREIATRLGISNARVNQIYYRAVERLRDAIAA